MKDSSLVVAFIFMCLVMAKAVTGSNEVFEDFFPSDDGSSNKVLEEVFHPYIDTNQIFNLFSNCDYDKHTLATHIGRFNERTYCGTGVDLRLTSGQRTCEMVLAVYSHGFGVRGLRPEAFYAVKYEDDFWVLTSTVYYSHPVIWSQKDLPLLAHIEGKFDEIYAHKVDEKPKSNTGGFGMEVGRIVLYKDGSIKSTYYVYVEEPNSIINEDIKKNDALLSYFEKLRKYASPLNKVDFEYVKRQKGKVMGAER